MLGIILPIPHKTARPTHIPTPVHGIIVKREVYDHFSSKNPMEHWPSPPTRYNVEKARLGIAAYPRQPGAQLTKWRSLAAWEPATRSRARATHRKPGHCTIWESTIHTTASNINRPWFTLDPETLHARLVTAEVGCRFWPPPRRSLYELLTAYHPRNRAQPAPAPHWRAEQRRGTPRTTPWPHPHTSLYPAARLLDWPLCGPHLFATTRGWLPADRLRLC